MASLSRARAGATTSGQPPAPAMRATPEPLVPVTGNGIGTDLRDAVLFLNRQELVLAIGKFVAIQNVHTQELSFLGSQSQQVTTNANVKSGFSLPTAHSLLGEVTAMALSQKTNCVAVCRSAVRTDEASVPATVTLYKISPGSPAAKSSSNRTDEAEVSAATRPMAGSARQRGTWLKTLSFDADRFVSTALSPDGKLVCCQTATAAWTLVVWDWSRARQIASVDIHCKVTRVRFNSIDMAQLSTSGSNLLRLWTLSEYTLKPFSSFKSGDETKVKRVVSYVDHVWLPNDCLVALLEDGGIQLIINAELIQTLRSVHNGVGKLACMTALSNGEGVVVGGTHGLISVVRVASKMMKADEKELHFQRRMRVRDTESILGLATDPAAATLLCLTERTYGSYDLSNLCLLRGDDDVIALEPLSSTPFSTNMEQLSTASGRACFAACCTLPGDEYAINVWNQEDSHECYLSHSLEQSTPLGLDVHPRGTELVVSFGSKMQVYFVLQDSLRLAFELAQKQIGIVKYSPSGSLFAGVHTTNKIIYLYQSCTRSQREPQLVGTISRDFRETLTNLLWSPHDTSFFAVDTVGEIHHCALRWQAGGEVEELVEVHSATQVQVKGSDIICAAACKIDRDSHDYVVFSAERVGSTSSSSAVSSLLRAWVNGDLSHEALRGPMGQIGEHLPVAVSSLAGSCGVPNLLFGGTAIGGIAILSWKRGKLDFDGHRMIELSSVLRVVDVHTSAVSGLFFVDRSRTLVSNSLNGVVLSCTVITDVNRFSSERAEMTQQLIGALPNDFSSNFIDLSNAFTSICQPDEIGFYDRNKIELARFKAMDVENELQQLKLENEMLTRQLGEQRTRFEESMKREITAATDQAEEARYQLRAELSAQMEGAIGERESRMHSLSSEARAAQDHYLYNTEKIQRECDLLRETLVAARLELTDATKTRTEREAVIVSKYEEKIQAQKRDHETERIQLQKELSLVNKKLAEVLGQQQQDYSEQMTLLSSSIETEKKKLSEQQSQAHGKIAGLNQEVKMLLAALTAKDHELGVMSKECDLKAREIDALKARLLEEHRATDMAMKEKTESLSQYCELKGMYENLQRLDGVHRSQIEILQRHLLPKEQEIDKMQQYMGQLHDANQEIVVQANLSDRFRVETQLKAKKHEREVAIAQRQLERTRHSIEVLQEELGELVRISAIQEKNTLVCEIVRIHKRLTRQLDVLQAKDDGSEEVNAELHRQTSFLLKDKQHQRRQLEMVNQEKRKLASALSFQNTTLMTELNALKRQNKELERRLKRFESHSRNDDGLHMMVIQRDARTDSGSPPESQQKVIDDFMDGRAVLHSREDRPESLAGNNDSVDNSNTPKAFNTMTARGKPAGGRPQSAAPVMSKRPATAGLSRQSWSRK